jgi:opacity protein-like surface antigen
MRFKKAHAIFALAGLLATTAPAWAQRGYRRDRGYSERDGAFRLHLGAFQPRGDSEYWEDKERDFTGDADDFESASFGLDYLLPISSRMSVMFSGSVFSGEATQSYRDFEDNFGDRIRHDTTLDVASATIGLVLHLTGPDAPLSPYLGVGGGAYPWRLEEDGDFIDFDTNPPDIFTTTLESEGVAFGWYWLAGLEAPISDRLSLFAEGRWTRVDDELADDFEGLGLGDLDLSGREFAAGISWNLW